MSIKFLCGIDFQHELEEGLADFYNSIEELKKEKPCWPACGIVELTMDENGKEIKHEWIVEQNFSFRPN